MTDHLDLFIDEGIESIDAMNNALLTLEKEPRNEDAIDAVFRHAHTLKGNAAALGFSPCSNLAHELEDLLEEVRSGEITIDGALMDEVFIAVDCIETMLGELDQYEEIRTDAGELVTRLQDVGTASSGSADEEYKSSADRSSTSEEGIRAEIAVADGGMLGVDATFVLNALDSVFDTYSVYPSRERVERGEFDQSFEILVDSEEHSLSDVLTDIPHVHDHEILTSEDTSSSTTATESSDSTSPEVEQVSSVRVDIDRLVELNELVEQLVTSRIRINREFELAGIETEAARDLEKISQRLRGVTMEMQLVPFDTISRGFPRIVRDTARELNKDIDLAMQGTDVEVDRRLLTRMKDPLIHVLRNAVDHGIEAADVRESQGKPLTGQIEIDVWRERDQVVVEVNDDGGGIDLEMVRQRAMSEGIATEQELATMPEEEIYSLLFHAGFSTADEVTDVSGRGVGMDVVHDTVTDLDGTVRVDSVRGEGTSIQFRLPLTMAVADVMMVESGGRLLGIPITTIEEISTDAIVKNVHGKAMAERQDHLSPVIDLATEFQGQVLADGGPADAEEGGKKLVIIREETRDVALACDAVIGQEEVVVKPLADILSGIPGVSGTAVLGDQQLVPIIDVVSI